MKSTEIAVLTIQIERGEFMLVLIGTCESCRNHLTLDERQSVKLLNDLTLMVSCPDCGKENDFMVDITQL